MSDTPSDSAVLSALTLKYEELAKKRKEDRDLRDWLTERLRDTHREMINLVVTARMFGGTLPFPEDEPETPKTSISELFRHAPVTKPAAFAGGAPEPTAVAGPSLEPPRKAPKIKDAVLEILRAAGEQGVRAAAIRQSLESTYRIRLHEKTVGMTLYRLSQADPPLARRAGITWFFVPPEAEKKNPGGDAPGPDNVFE